jgi:hypothetical protein
MREGLHTQSAIPNSCSVLARTERYVCGEIGCLTASILDSHILGEVFAPREKDASGAMGGYQLQSVLVRYFSLDR